MICNLSGLILRFPTGERWSRSADSPVPSPAASQQQGNSPGRAPSALGLGSQMLVAARAGPGSVCRGWPMTAVSVHAEYAAGEAGACLPCSRGQLPGDPSARSFGTECLVLPCALRRRAIGQMELFLLHSRCYKGMARRGRD